MGGIMDADDALEFIVAGASAVQVGTANFVRPRAAVDVAEGLRERLAARGIGSIRELIGSLAPAGASR
jgi:dihydroorotate dehydrogenase (NAD+) catalytic subunit